MDNTSKKKTPLEHIYSIYQEYTKPSRVLRSFTNLSNTVIQTALSGQSKFIFEILQNADDAFEDKNKPIYVQFILQDGFLIVHHNGKGFDYNDVERICDYASQIAEVKANDLSKTGYKGLGFKSLFNLSDCIYIHSNGYSFRFDKTHWNNPQERPWQIIPIWCEYKNLPLHEKFPHDQPVNFILKLKNVEQLRNQLIEVIHQPELLLFLHRVDKLNIILGEDEYLIERIKAEFECFNSVQFFINQQIVSTWLLKMFNPRVPIQVHKSIKEFSRYIYPDKIKSAKNVPITFAVCVDAVIENVIPVNGLCYGTLPTQLHLNLPYHVNSLFILNLDRTQLHENEWNEFLICKVGYMQLKLLQNLALIPNLRNYIIQLLVREVAHPYQAFRKAFLIGFEEAQKEIEWLPTNQGRLLKLGEAWTDEIQFFRQNFPNIRDHTIFPYIINYDVLSQTLLERSKTKIFNFKTLLSNFPQKYYPQLTETGYINFIDYLYRHLGDSHRARGFLKSTYFLRAKDGSLICPKGAWLEDSENPLPGFLKLNPVDYRFLPPHNASYIKAWLIELGAKRLKTPVDIIRESILENNIEVNEGNHIEIINYLAINYEHLPNRDFEKLKMKRLVLTESNEFTLPRFCYLPDAVPLKELKDVLASNEKISSVYDMESLKDFFIRLGVHDRLDPLDVFRRSIFKWLGSKNDMKFYLNRENYACIMEYVAENYFEIERKLEISEKRELRKLLVLTSSNKLERAEKCYFDTAIPDIQGLGCIIAANKLVSTHNISDEMKKFLTAIGVSTEIKPIEVIRKTVLPWIYQQELQQRITIENHTSILEYIAKHWWSLPESALNQDEIKTLSQILVMTKGNSLREAYQCYWSVEDHTGIDDIPEIESIIPLDEFVSPNYSRNVKNFIQDLNIRTLKFTTIYERYSDHLSKPNNIKWFFSKLVKHWQQKKEKDTDKLLKNLQKKFKSSRLLLGRDNKMYRSTELYSSQLFETIHAIYPNCMPLLCYDKIPEDLELWLGLRRELDLPCIERLFEAMYKKPLCGTQTETFFTMLLKQLRQKNKSEIRKYKLSLLAKNNKLRSAQSLYYFKEEEAECIVDSCYLKRIHSMSHKDTLELADLCGVNILPFEHHVTFEEQKCDSTLKEFYFERLPFIVIQEANLLNEQHSVTLKRLYEKICSIELYQCRIINIQYPFGNSNTRNHFDELKLYVIRKWTNFKSKIHCYLKEKLHITAYIDDIIDMETVMQEDIDDWLDENKEDRDKFNSIQKELQLLKTKKDTELIYSVPENEEIDFEDLDDVSVEDESNSVTSPIIKIEESEDCTDVDETRSVASSLDEDVIDVNIEWPVLGRSDSDDRVNEYIVDNDISDFIKDAKMQHSTTPGNFSFAEAVSSTAEDDIIIRVEPTGILPESSEKLQIQRLGETYAFTFLQDHYKNKYPRSEFNISGGVFTLWYEPPRKIEINWINESQEKKFPYDILLKKDGDIKRLIEVKSSSTADGDSFDVSHLKFIKRMSRLAEFQPQHKQKYCLYRLFNVESLTSTSSEKNVPPTALYKVMLLKNS